MEPLSYNVTDLGYSLSISENEMRTLKLTEIIALYDRHLCIY